MKGVFSKGPRVDVAEDLVSRLPELSAKSGVNFTVLYELISTTKILSVPNHATAHIRGSRVNVLVLAKWNTKDTDKLDTVRSATSELRSIILRGERDIPESENTGYGNYSKCPAPYLYEDPCAHMSLPASDEIESAVPGDAGSGGSADALFGENYTRLQHLKQQYDPDLIFFKWQPITPQA